MNREAVYVTIFSILIAMAGGLYVGLNQGVALSETHGPTAACNMLRWSIYDCTTFTR